VIHEKVVDTAVIYPSTTEGRKNALRFLSEKYLHQSIQLGTHDSVQDALAALRLALLKFKNGTSLFLTGCFTEAPNIFLFFLSFYLKTKHFFAIFFPDNAVLGPSFGLADTESLFKVLSDFTHKSVLLDSVGICRQYAKGALHSIIPVSSDEELTEKTVSQGMRVLGVGLR
jgi:hypothetical protein